jgi:hypothetical protein
MTAAGGNGPSVTRRTSISPVISGWIEQRYGYAPGRPAVHANVAPGTSSPEAKASAVTVCARGLTLAHCTVSLGRTSSVEGTNWANWTPTS